MKPRILFAGLAASALIASGCASFEPRPAPLTRDELVQMAKAGETAPAMVAQLRRTDTVLLLSASDLVSLAQAGVPAEVLDYLQTVQIAEIRRRDQFERWLYAPYFGPSFAPFMPCPGWRGPGYPPVGGMRSPYWPHC